MPYNSQVTRTDATPLIPEQVVAEIIQNVPESSAIMRLARRLPNMSRGQMRLPVLSALVTAYFRDGDTGLAQTTEAAWTNKYINAGELVCIVPIPKTVLEDADYDAWSQVKPDILAAFGKAFDQAVMYGTNAPSTWPTALVTAATTASHTASLAAFTDVYDAILGTGGSVSFPEADGYDVTGHVGAMSMKATLRGLRDANGQPIFMRSMQETTRYELDGAEVVFPTNSSVVAASSLLISGDFSQIVYSIRRDMEWELFTEGVIQDAAGAITYNLMQQGMVALQGTMRIGWQLPNPVNRMQETEASRYPFGVLTA